MIFEHLAMSSRIMITIMHDLQQMLNNLHVLTLYLEFKNNNKYCRRTFQREEERRMFHTQKTRVTNPKLNEEKIHSN
jgi:hypothetical protein